MFLDKTKSSLDFGCLFNNRFAGESLLCYEG